MSLSKHATAEDVTAGIDLRGKTAVVTGVTAGLGYETMRVLALRGAHVLGTARSGDAGQHACRSIDGCASPFVLDLAEFESVTHCADQIRAMQVPVDMLVCNAGIMQRRVERVRGLEKHFVVNHLGHFILVNRLRPQIEAAEQGRVVVLSSEAHRAARAGIEFDNLTGERGFTGHRAYGHSKLANGLFSLELARRLAGSRATSNSVHPGVVRTQIARYLPRWQQVVFHAIGPWLLKSVAEGAATSCYVAADPGLAGVSGRYFADCRSVAPSPWMRDEAMAAKLWSVSERLTREFLL